MDFRAGWRAVKADECVGGRGEMAVLSWRQERAQATGTPAELTSLAEASAEFEEYMSAQLRCSHERGAAAPTICPQSPFSPAPDPFAPQIIETPG